MQVVVRLFASYREAAGASELRVDLPAGATVQDAIRATVAEHPSIGGRRTAIVARNREYVSADEPLADGDEVALIPPVSGGATRLAPIAITDEPLSVDTALDEVRDSAFGGVVVFLGTVRDNSRGKSVTRLEYEAYAEMAEAKMRDIAIRARGQHGPMRVAMHHRTGSLDIGEIAVIVAVAAPHRDAAFAAARQCIDELKQVVPIWKKEHTDDGAIWIEDHA